MGLLITKLRRFIAESAVGKKFLKSVNIWQSYKQERDCFVHFFRLLAVFWPSTQSSRDSHVLACNFAKYSPILKIFSNRRLSNKSS